MTVRKAMLAGSWYPGSAEECSKQIAAFVATADADSAEDIRYRGGVVPHAGWVYSGRLACRVFHRLAQQSAPDAVVVFGMHMAPSATACIMTRGAWQTPLGDVDIHETLADELAGRFAFNRDRLQDFSRDNTIELQTSFIRHFFPETPFVPVGVPPTAAAIDLGKAVADIAAAEKINALVIGSTDLTHYGPNYGFMPEGGGLRALEWVRNDNDRPAIQAILDLDPGRILREGLHNSNACCCGAVAAAVAAASAAGAEAPRLLAYGTSYDVSPGSSFVGYAGILL